jgi:hypothetical protein
MLVALEIVVPQIVKVMSLCGLKRDDR